MGDPKKHALLFAKWFNSACGIVGETKLDPYRLMRDLWTGIK